MNSTTTQRPTPETDALSDSRIGMWAFNLPIDFARRLERERDEAREQLEATKAYAERCKQGCIKLSFAIDRIDYACGESNEFEVSGYALHQNEEHVVKRVKEEFEAMREAIKDAHYALAYVYNHGEGSCAFPFRTEDDLCSENRFHHVKDALDALKPFLS
jgi:hypothetical protein